MYHSGTTAGSASIWPQPPGRSPRRRLSRTAAAVTGLALAFVALTTGLTTAPPAAAESLRATPAAGPLRAAASARPLHAPAAADPLRAPAAGQPHALPASANSIPTGPASASGVVEFGCARPARPGQERCYGLMKGHRTPSRQLAPTITGSPSSSGYTPSDLRSAYRLAGTSGSGRTVAIVDAYDDPQAESDLAAYRSAYGLPACSTANGCFRKVNQNGQQSPLPSGDYGWAEEISLDLDMVSAICPDCHILLVESNSAYTSDLARAEDQAAATPGVVSISNSWGASEDSSITSSDSHFNHPGIAITASSGDSGYGVSWPASSPYVTAVGGTSLTRGSNTRGWTERVWSGAGSGCSAYEPKPAWQHDTGCARRTVADVSAVADPNTGVAVYDTYNSCGSNGLCDLLLSLGLAQGVDGWIQVGGTSVSSPIIASDYALAGNTAQTVGGSYPYGHTSALNDVTSGSNGACGGSYLCSGAPGYDGPTGLGTPIGTGAF